MTGMTPELQWENDVVLQILQAFLGLMTQAISGISVRVDGDRIHIYVAVTDNNSLVIEDIEDAIGDVEGGLWPLTPTVTSSIYQGSAYDGWEGRQHRMVFLEKYDGDEYKAE